jgi:phospholipid N-methyltransferase
MDSFFHFFKESVASIATTGTIKPSSKYLIKNCLKNLVLPEADHIIEFGPGNGCITQQLAANIADSTHLYSFEVNPNFYAHCSEKFSAHDNVFILNESAFNFDTVLEKASIQQVDYIISSLPLALFDDSDIDVLLDKVHHYLKKGGIFIQYQYSLSMYKQLKRTFNVVKLDLTVRNLPPAFVYKCRK